MTMASTAWGSVSIDTTDAPWLVNISPVVAITPIPGAWVSSAKWVGTSAADGSTGVAPGDYVFTLAIGGYANGPGTFALNYSGDNNVVWSIDGGGTLSGATSCTSGTCFTSLFVLSGTYGANSVLTATVTNLPPGTNPMGLLVTGGTATSASEVPEPSTYAMVAIGAAAVFISRFRRA